MSSVQSITVVLDDGSSFQVDTAANCLLVWNDAGWAVLEEYYAKAKGEKHRAKEVKDRTCAKAKPKGGAALTAAAPLAAAAAVFALKTPDCTPTQWP